MLFLLSRRSLFLLLRATFRWEVREWGSGLLAAGLAFFSYSSFFLKKLTLNTPMREFMNSAPLPVFTSQFSLILSPLF